MQRNHRRAEAGFGHHFRFRIVLLDRGVVRIDLGLRFRDRRARFQSRDHVRAAAARVARFRSTLFHTGFYRKKNARLGREKTKSGRQDADDLSWDTIYAGVTTQNVWIGIETLPPEFVRQDNHVRMGVGLFIGEVATDRGAYTKGREKFRRDAHDFLLLHGARITDGFSSLHVHGKAREGRDVAATLVVIGDRRAVVFHAGFRISVVNRDQPVCVWKWKWTEQDGIDHRENRRFAPRQIAMVASAVSVNAGALRGWRKARRRSVITTTSFGWTLPQFYSVRNACTGSTSVARRAGNRHATNAVAASNKVAPPS